MAPRSSDQNPAFAVPKPTRVHFSLSPASSRSTSPTPWSSTGTAHNAGFKSAKAENPMEDAENTMKPDSNVYDVVLPWWRARIRRWIVERVRKESLVLARFQETVRTPWLDAYFVYTSSLGTHTFFMIGLPAFFFFGYAEMGHGLLVVIAGGIYCSSFLKDSICSPRPFAPPVTRLTIGTHHLEYGFPSTHSTNSTSIALFLFAHFHRLYATVDPETSEPIISSEMFGYLALVLIWYTSSIVFGRLYTAMHSFTDCVMGVFIGTAVWWCESSWEGIPITLSSSNPLFWLTSLLNLGSPLPIDASQRLVYLGQGLGLGQRMSGWVQSGGWEVPVITMAITLLGVNQHPQPVDDCPCFEDAIAIASVGSGVLLGAWVETHFGVGVGRVVVQPGSGWVLQAGEWVSVERTMGDVMLWWSVSVVKMVVGVLAIFVWRLVAKSILHKVLPPTFRMLARVFSLPNRRFYTPATDYKSVPSDFVATGDGGFALRSIPSVIDLAGTTSVEVGGIGSGGEVKSRGGGEKGQHGLMAVVNEKEKGEEFEKVKHYDADVLTKVFVYAGIGLVASQVMPFVFELVGWGVHSWPVLASPSPISVMDALYDVNCCLSVPEQLENERVRLEPLIPAIHGREYFEKSKHHPEMYTYLPYGPFQTEEEWNRLIEMKIRSQDGAVLFAVFDKTRGALAGVMGYMNTSLLTSTTEMGCVEVFPEFQGTHVAVNAIGLLLHYALDAKEEGGLGLKKVVWMANERNAKSIGVAEKMGFKREGLYRWAKVVKEAAAANGRGRGRAGDPRREAFGRDTVALALCWDEWAGGGREMVDARGTLYSRALH